MKLIWATRGRTWGFRFLRNGGFADPLPEYDKVFSDIEDKREVWRRVGETAGLRFPDPLGRKDRAGRVIPHEFVVFGPLTDEITSVEDGRQRVWPLVANDFANYFELPKPPSANK
ncbi:hypothetical protein AAIH25_01510 [Arthrobacter crystallopoietes]|uniref:hypothetical protein n=1 Tax=Crystallibacter crystallopoietes TaxID=37928 RepID=UPI003D1A2878